MLRRALFLSILAVVCGLAAGTAAAQKIGDRVELRHADGNASGVPVHPADNDRSYQRWPNGTLGTVTDQGRWFEIRSDSDQEGWVSSTHLVVLEQDDEGDVAPLPTVEREADGEDEGPVPFVVGTWNLEHFAFGSGRGFPENLQGGPKIPPRTPADVQLIASTIRDRLMASILVLTEINGQAADSSDELDQLIGFLGDGWQYRIGVSGLRQRVAMLFDERWARVGDCLEPDIPEERLEDKDIWFRDPLACEFQLVDADGTAVHDLVVIGVHLASGQRRDRNHNRAMEELGNRLAQLFDGDPFDSAERDLVVTGDFNANFFDTRDVEDFWIDYAGDFDVDVIAPTDAEDYPPTRLAKVPLHPFSRIDYVMVSESLVGELINPVAHVHHELITDFAAFREHLSDHIPVTVRIRRAGNPIGVSAVP